MRTERAENSLDSQISSQNNRDSTENKLLLCCVRYQFNSATASDVINLLRTDLNWELLVRNAAQHNVFMLVYQTLKQTHSDRIPSSVFEKLQIEAQKRMTYNLFLTNKLFQVLNLFTTHKIQAIPFKGPTWAKLAYDNLALREFCDLDILVRPQDFSKAQDLLREEGYFEKRLHPEEIIQIIRQVQMVLPDHSVNIDLHYNLVTKHFYLDIEPESFFEELQTLPLFGKTVTTVSPENAIIITYLNGTKERWKSLKRICDFGALIQTYPEANWQKILDQWVTHEEDRAFWLGIAITQTYLQIPLPEILSEKLKQFPELLQLTQKHQQLFENNKESEYKYIFRVFNFLEKKEMNLWSKVHFFFNIFLQINEKDRDFFPVPQFLFFLYYPIRIIRLIKTYNIDKAKLSLLFNLFRH